MKRTTGLAAAAALASVNLECIPRQIVKQPRIVRAVEHSAALLRSEQRRAICQGRESANQP
jgi:hypothetical protein